MFKIGCEYCLQNKISHIVFCSRICKNKLILFNMKVYVYIFTRNVCETCMPPTQSLNDTVTFTFDIKNLNSIGVILN